MALLLLGATLFTSFLLSTLLVRTSISVAARLNAYDRPDSPRKLQEAPVPRLGGVAVAVGFLLMLVVGYVYLGGVGEFAEVLGIGIPALALALLGLADDYVQLSPRIRLVAQFTVAVVAVFLGTSVDLTGSTLVDAGISVLWIVAIVNGVNLLDNSDGLAASTVLVAATGCLAVTLFSGQEVIGLLAAALVGLCGGFLVFNWFPARVYLGDAGAYFLGFLLAVLTIRLRPVGISFPATALIPLLLAALPLADTSFVIVQRLRARVHPFSPGRDHLSHELQKRGFSVPISVLLLQLGLIATSAGAVLISGRVSM